MEEDQQPCEFLQNEQLPQAPPRNGAAPSLDLRTHSLVERNMTALPPAPDVEHLLIERPTSIALSAYRNIILPAEQAALSKLEDDKAKLIHARVVGYLLLYPPSQKARRILALEIVSCGGKGLNERHEAVFALGATYLRHLICICKLLSSLSRH